MKSTFGRLLIAIVLFAGIVCIGTCTFTQHAKPPQRHPERDSIALQWKKEKAQLQVQYHKQIDNLQTGNDSLQREVVEKKKALASYRVKAKRLKDRLKSVLENNDSVYVRTDSLKPLAYDYFAAQNDNNTSCDSTIKTLEQIIANRDTSIVLFRKSETNIRDLQREQELRNQLLEDELNTAYKAQKKKVRQNKLLAGGLIFISGFATTLLISQTIK